MLQLEPQRTRVRSHVSAEHGKCVMCEVFCLQRREIADSSSPCDPLCDAALEVPHGHEPASDQHPRHSVGTGRNTSDDTWEGSRCSTNPFLATRLCMDFGRYCDHDRMRPVVEEVTVDCEAPDAEQRGPEPGNRISSPITVLSVPTGEYVDDVMLEHIDHECLWTPDWSHSISWSVKPHILFCTRMETISRHCTVRHVSTETSCTNVCSAKPLGRALLPRQKCDRSPSRQRLRPKSCTKAADPSNSRDKSDCSDQASGRSAAIVAVIVTVMIATG